MLCYCLQSFLLYLNVLYTMPVGLASVYTPAGSSQYFLFQSASSRPLAGTSILLSSSVMDYSMPDGRRQERKLKSRGHYIKIYRKAHHSTMVCIDSPVFG